MPASGRAGLTLFEDCLTQRQAGSDRKSTRLNSSHDQISYAVFCLKKKKIFVLEQWKDEVEGKESEGPQGGLGLSMRHTAEGIAVVIRESRHGRISLLVADGRAHAA